MASENALQGTIGLQASRLTLSYVQNFLITKKKNWDRSKNQKIKS